MLANGSMVDAAAKLPVAGDVKTNLVSLSMPNSSTICEICGLLIQNLENLKQHMKTVHRINSLVESGNNSAASKLERSKIGSLIALAKSGSITGSLVKTSRTTLNIPQSMTVFNLKDISVKLLNSSKSPTTNIDANSQQLQTKNNEKDERNTGNEANVESSSESLQLSNKNEPQKLVVKLEPSKGEPLSPKITTILCSSLSSNTVLTPKLVTCHQQFQQPQQHSQSYQPYHYSEFQHMYICNLCNSAYDSLRSMKAHLWKHSGHHELSYPIHDYNNNCTKTVLEAAKPLILSPTCPSAQLLSTSLAVGTTLVSNSTISNNLSSGGGICSVLLEVIEQKIRDVETIDSPIVDRVETKLPRKRKSTGDNTISTRTDSVDSDDMSHHVAVKRSKSKTTTTRKEKKPQTTSSNEATLDAVTNDKTSSMSIYEPCTIETNVVSSIYDDEDDLIYINNNNMSKDMTESTGHNMPVTPTGSSVHSNKYGDILKLLELLANNDGNEQYQCGLCSYICYHLPSLKSHMWSHVKNEKFDYSRNTSIINAAIDYENKLNRNLSSINSMLFNNTSNGEDDTESSSESSSTKSSTPTPSCNKPSSANESLIEKKLLATLELINLNELNRKLAEQLATNKMCQYQITDGIVSFKCSKCKFQTTELCLLRLHKKQEHLDLPQTTLTI